MKTQILLSDFEELVLKRPLPSCPKGRILKKRRGGGFFVNASDDEYLKGTIKFYEFSNDEINRNPRWFGKSK